MSSFMIPPQSHYSLGLAEGRISKAILPAASLLNPTDPTLAPFLDACKQGDISTVSKLATDRDATDGSLNWGLYAALSAHQPKIASILLDRGASIDKRAIMDTSSQDCFQVLIEHGWGINDGLEAGNTVFPRIIALNNESLIRWFLSQGANPDLGTPRGPFHIFPYEADSIQPTPGSGASLNAAAERSTPAVFDLLLSHGANIKNSQPLHRAVASIWLTENERLEMMQHVVSLGADVNQDGKVPSSNYNGGTALHAAAFWGRLPEARWLLEHGVDIRRGNDFILLAWTEASRHQDEEVVKFLKEWELLHCGSIMGPKNYSGEVGSKSSE